MIRHPLQNVGAMQTEVTQINQEVAQVERQTGRPVPRNEEVAIAADGTATLGDDEDDLQSAEDASDGAVGDLSAQQAGHRIEALQVSEQLKTRQFLEAQALQKASDDAALAAWETQPSTLAGRL